MTVLACHRGRQASAAGCVVAGVADPGQTRGLLGIAGVSDPGYNNQFRSTICLALLLFSVVAPAAALAAPTGSPSLPRWEPHDFAFPGPAQIENPFAAGFSAEIAGPDGVVLSQPGFFDGNATWKLRVAPPAIGNWQITTHSSISALDGRHTAFVCVPNSDPREHGPVLIDPNAPHQFVFADGTRFFPLGYECDWLWALDTHDPSLRTVNPFLGRIAASGFNFVILNAFAYDTSWRKGKTGPDDYGPPPLFPWAGSNAAPDFSRFNLEYWQHYDGIVAALHRHGLWAHVLLKVYNKQVHWPAKRSAEEDRYIRWLVARYAAYPNLTWDLSKEAQYEKDVTYKLDRLRLLRASDPYHRLVTVHDDRETYDRGTYNSIVDYRSDQQHTDWHAVMLAHLRQRAWPVINTEFGYEQGPGGPTDKTYNRAQAPEEVARRAWEVCASGGFGVYYTYTAWDVLRVYDTPPGYRYFRNLRAFFEGTRYWRLRPLEGAASAGFCLGEPGQEYVVFLSAAAPFTLTVPPGTGTLKAKWYHPYTEEYRSAGPIARGVAALVPPKDWGSAPVALHLWCEPNE